MLYRFQINIENVLYFVSKILYKNIFWDFILFQNLSINFAFLFMYKHFGYKFYMFHTREELFFFTREELKYMYTFIFSLKAGKDRILFIYWVEIAKV